MGYLFFEYVCFHAVILKLLIEKPAAVNRPQYLKLKLKLSGRLTHKKLCVLFVRLVCGFLFALFCLK